MEYDTISKNLIQKFIFDTVATPIVILKTGYDGNLYGYTNNYNTQNEYILKYNPSLNHLDTLFSTSQFSQYGSSIINFELNSNKTLVLISTIKGGLNSRGAVTLYDLTNNTVVYNLPNDSDLFKPNTFYKCYFLNDSTISFYATSDIANSSTSTFITTLTTGSQSFTTPVYIQNYNNYRLIYYSNLLPDGKIYSLFQQFNNNFAQCMQTCFVPHSFSRQTLNKNKFLSYLI